MKINIAQIGVGYWGPNLLRNLISNERCNVKSVIEVSAERREYINNNFRGINVSNNYEDILKDEKIDAVIISTPVASHFEIAIKCLKAGKHILVEKPIATKVEQVKIIGELSKKNKLIAMVGHTFLFNPAVRYVKELINKNEIGDIRYIYSQRLNLGRIREDVDVMWNLAPHDISIIQYWLNDPNPIKITKNSSCYIQKGIDDVVFLNIQYPDNISANIHVSWLDPNKIRRMTIVGSEKMVVYDDIAENKIEIYNKGIDKIAILGKNMDYDLPQTFTFNYRNSDKFIPKIQWTEPLKVELDHFFDCILLGTPCLTGINHAEKVVEILEKASSN